MIRSGWLPKRRVAGVVPAQGAPKRDRSRAKRLRIREKNSLRRGAAPIGNSALFGTTSSFNIGLGYDAGSAHVTGDNNIYIGHRGIADETGIIRIGTPGTHTQTYLQGTVTATSFVGDGSALTNVRAVYQP